MRQRVIWYVEDDEDIARYVVALLEDAGYRARPFPSGLAVRNAFPAESPDALLIDWNLPDDAGPSVCRWVRRHNEALPVMMVTVRDEPSDIVAGLRAGADDYVTKPFHPDVLLGRIEALLRRSPAGTTTLTCGDVTLDGERHRVSVGGAPVELAPLEYRILSLLMERKGRLVSREALRDRAWEDGRPVSDNALTVTVKRLRAKLAPADCLKTIRSFGYRMEEPR